jgi:type I restriction enzyme R subunit
MNADYSEDHLVQENAAETFEKLEWESYLAYDNSTKETLEIFSKEVPNHTSTGSESVRNDLKIGLQSDKRYLFLGRESQEDILLKPYLIQALKDNNDWIKTDEDAKPVIEVLENYTIAVTDINMIVEKNREFYYLLRDGVHVETRNESGEIETRTAKIFNYDYPEKNYFVFVREFWMKSKIDGTSMRADGLGFVNGIPLLFTEFKRVDIEVKTAYSDNYKRSIENFPYLFYFNAFSILSNGEEAKMGTIGAKFKFFSEWKRKSEDDDVDENEPQMHIMIEGTCNKTTFMDLFENFIIFDNSTENYIKIIARNHQYLGVNRAFESYKEHKFTDKKIGVFWHTQGSGKSYSILFLSQKIHRKLSKGKPTIVIITDRNELNKQISGTFEAAGALGNLEASKYMAKNGEDLYNTLKNKNPSYIFTLIHKFNKTVGVSPIHKDHDILLISDEAHRTNNGIFAENMCKMLPEASRLGFTGTPLFERDNITVKTFGEYVSVYDFQRAVEDGNTVPLYYENRGEKLKIENPDIDEKLLEIIQQAEEDEENEFDEKDIDNLKNQIKKQLHIICSEERLRKIAKDFVDHYSDLWQTGKAMFVSVDKVTAVRMYNYVQEYWQEKIKEVEKNAKNLDQQELIEEQYKIDWMKKTEMHVIISSSKDDDKNFAKWGLNVKPHKEYMEDTPDYDKQFKDENNPFRVAFVCAMWLTGFDVPSLGTLYLDKPLKEHTLMQAIARANRINEGKENGLIVDYIGIVPYLEKALADYTINKQKTKKVRPTISREELVKEVEKNCNSIVEFLECHGFILSELTDTNDKNQKIRKIKEAVNILVTPPEDTKKRFSLLCSQFFRLYKYLLPSEISTELRKSKGGIEVIYKRLNKRHTPADITNVMIEMQKVVNEYIKLDNDFSTPTESVKIDISSINFEVLQKEFEKVKEKAIIIHDIAEILNVSIEALCREVPTSMQFFEHYKELIENYNKAQDKAEIRKVFEELQKTAEILTEQQKRYIREGFKDNKELAVYDLLFKEELTSKEIKQIKALSVKLLNVVKERLAEMHNPFEKRETASAIDILIRDTLWQELPDSCFGDLEIYRHKIFDYIQSQFKAA